MRLTGLDRAIDAEKQPAAARMTGGYAWLRPLAALVVCCGAVGAYIAAGKYAAFFSPVLSNPRGSVTLTFAKEFIGGWVFSGLSHTQVRHTILLNVGMAFAAVSTCRALAPFLAGRAGAMAAGTAMLGFASVHQAGWALWAHHDKLVQVASDISIVNALRTAPPPPDGALVTIEARQQRKAVYDSVEANLLLYQSYGRASWTAMVVPVASGPSWAMAVKTRAESLALVDRWKGRIDQRYLMVAGDFVATGCEASMLIDVPQPSWFDLLWRAPFTPRDVRAAMIIERRSTC